MKRAFVILSVLDTETGEEEVVGQAVIDGVEEEFLRSLLRKLQRDIEYTIYKAMLCYHANTLPQILRCKEWLSSSGA